MTAHQTICNGYGNEAAGHCRNIPNVTFNSLDIYVVFYVVSTSRCGSCEFQNITARFIPFSECNAIVPWSVDWRILQDCLNVNGNATNLARTVHSSTKTMNTSCLILRASKEKKWTVSGVLCLASRNKGEGSGNEFGFYHLLLRFVSEWRNQRKISKLWRFVSRIPNYISAKNL